jgi:hypothetical protein
MTVLGSRKLEAVAFAAVTTGFLVLHGLAATRVGFGDSEALYASYALHAQPAYLDHPGLVGLLARLVGHGTAPSPALAHAVTTLLCALFPALLAVACRACGASWRRSFAVGFVAAVVPEVAIGMFAMTPDLLLGLTWTGCLALAALGLRAPPGGLRATVCLAWAGLLAGLAATAKVSGGLLFVALAVTYAGKPARRHARTLAPWAGLAAGGIVFAPVVAFEAATGWPMLRHRLLATQAEAGLSLRNAGALLGGQLAYLSPLVAVLVVLAAREAWRGRGRTVGALLWASFAIPLAVLAPLCLWSRVAEPHWIAPALLALGPAAARASRAPRRGLVISAAALSLALVLMVNAWVLVPTLIEFAPASYDPRVDIANELRGWPEAVRAVREEASALGFRAGPGRARDLSDLAIVGPHWVVCAQLEAALEGQLPVGCDTPIPDDFDSWRPRARWRTAETILWVSDNRFGPAPPQAGFVVQRVREVPFERGGVTVRVFSVTVLTRRARA